MKEVQGSGNDKQKLLQECLVKSPVVEQISQIRQTETQRGKNQTLMNPMWPFEVEVVKRHTQMLSARVSVRIDGLYMFRDFQLLGLVVVQGAHFESDQCLITWILSIQ